MITTKKLEDFGVEGAVAAPPKPPKPKKPKGKVHVVEDYGVRNATTPEERLRVYQDQALGMSPKVRARFWLGCLEHDPEVAAIVKAGGNSPKRRRRRGKANVPIHQELGQFSENGGSQT